MPKIVTFNEVKKFIEKESASGCRLLSNEYVHSHENLNIRCRCGNTFKKSWVNFKHNNQRCCNECCKKISMNKPKSTAFLQYKYGRPNNEQKAISLFESKHLIMIDDYKRNDQEIRYYCKKHPTLIQKTSYRDLKKRKNHPCELCSGTTITRYDIEKATEIFISNNYVLLENNYLGYTNKMRCYCKNHHNVVQYKTLKSFIMGNGCPYCNESKGEKRIREWLIINNMPFEYQKEFKRLIGLGGRNLSYDYYLPDFNLLIEYQGEYHDGTARNQTKENFIKQQEHDKRKREYAEKNNINLLEIWYWDFDRIEEILERELKHSLKYAI